MTDSNTTLMPALMVRRVIHKHMLLGRSVTQLNDTVAVLEYWRSKSPIR